MNKLTTAQKLLLLLVVWFLLNGSGRVSPPPFVATKLCVLCVEDSSAAGRRALTTQQDGIMRNQDDASPRAFTLKHGGEWQVIDPANNPAMDAEWVKAAVAVKRDGQPWIVAASPRGGFSVAIPKDANPADFVQRLQAIAPQ